MNRKVLAVLSKDSLLRPALNKKLTFDFKVSENLYEAISSAIIGQQLSNKAAAAIEKRFRQLFSGKLFPQPEKALKISDQQLRDCGLSWQKVKYLKNLSQAVLDGTLVLNELQNFTDAKVIEALVQIKGIGRWTAEMILIFDLSREDVFSVGDLGLRTAVSKLYKVDRNNLKAIEKISQNWKPYRSYACRFLWDYFDTLKLSPKSL